MKGLFNRIRKRFTRSCGRNIDYDTMHKMIMENRNIVIIDVRTKDEFLVKHITGAINIPLQDLKERIENVVKDKNEVIVLYCEYGGRSRKALSKLEKLGYLNVYNLDGGIEKI